MMRYKPFLSLCLLFIFISSFARGQTQHVINTPAKSGYTIRVIEAFEGIPARGFLPVKVEITNGSKKSATWKLTTTASIQNYGWNSNEMSMNTSRVFTVPAGEKRVFEVLCPIPDRGKGGRSFNGMITGPQTMGSWWASDYRTSGKQPVYGIVSKSLGLEYGGKLHSYMQSIGYDLGTIFEVAFYSTDWRAYTGVDLFWFQQSDWEALSPAVQNVLLEWVASGGDLRILKDEKSAQTDLVAGLPNMQYGWHSHGAGLIRIYPYMDEASLFPKKLADAAHRNQLGASFWEPYRLRIGQPLPAENQNQQDLVAIQSTIEAKGINFTLIIISMIAFGLIVGPANLWFFARGSKRYRLLYTTPIIAIGFSGLLAGSILISDGVGGEGKIARLFFLLPESNKEVLFQTEYAETGLLLGTSFSAGPSDWIDPLGHSVVSADALQLMGSYEEAKGDYWGSWFGSRRIQALSVKSVRPSRARFEVQPTEGDALEVKSSFPGVCRELYYLADENRIFKAEAVSTGRPVTLTPTTRKDFEQWFGKTRVLLGSELGDTLRKTRLAPGQIFAQVEHYTGEAPVTLDSIDWEIYETLVISEAVLPEKSQHGGKQ